MSSNLGVHISHCCVLHGCKYGQGDCPVQTGDALQLYLCEFCCFDNEEQPGRITRCTHCGSIRTKWSIDKKVNPSAFTDGAAIVVRGCLNCSETLEVEDAQEFLDRTVNINWDNIPERGVAG